MAALLETAKVLLENYVASLSSLPYSRGHNLNLSRIRSSRTQMFFKIGVLFLGVLFANFTGKHRCYSLFLIKKT